VTLVSLANWYGVKVQRNVTLYTVPSSWIAVQSCAQRSRARGFGAAERTLDGEDSSEIITGEGKVRPLHPLKTPNSPDFCPYATS